MANKIIEKIEQYRTKANELYAEANHLDSLATEIEKAYKAGLDEGKTTINSRQANETLEYQSLKPESQIAQVYEIIKKRGALHVSAIAKALGEDNKKKQASLAGHLRQNAKDGRLFKKVAPNTYGLLEHA